MEDNCKNFYAATDAIEKFLNNAYTETDNIILTGAGTSAFIGLSLQAHFFATQKLLQHQLPQQILFRIRRIILMNIKLRLSFLLQEAVTARKVAAAIELADKFSKKCFHFIITCDKDGALAQYQSNNPSYIFVLPEAANDKSLAMTGSYSSCY